MLRQNRSWPLPYRIGTLLRQLLIALLALSLVGCAGGASAPATVEVQDAELFKTTPAPTHDHSTHSHDEPSPTATPTPDAGQ